MDLRTTASCVLACALACVLVTSAHAQGTDYVPPSDEVANALAAQKKAAEEAAADAAKGPPDGWTLKVELGLNGALTNTANVVGADDGNTVQFGIAVKGQAALRAGDHEWRNELAIAHAQTQTPALPVFVKGTDQLDVSSMYLYHIPSIPWLGPFARARLQTSLFSGRLVVADPATPVTLDGAPTPLDTKTEDEKSYGFLELTDPFQPLLLRESLGVFAQPLDDKTLRLTISLGGGAQQVFAEGGRAVTDDVATPVIEVSTLADSQQIGAELDVAAVGSVTDTIGYALGVNVLYPFYSDPESTVGGKILEGLDLTNVEITGKVSVKLASWASLDYVLSAKYLPLIIDEWQVSNGLLLNSSFNLL